MMSATMLVLADEANPGCVIVERVPVATRVRAHLCAHRLDRALATGIEPDSRADLLVRAHDLIGSRGRAALARVIYRLIEDARCPAGPLSFSIPMCRDKVWRSRHTLRALADRLLCDEPVAARGLAQLHLLFTDGAGPIYHAPRDDDLEPVLEAALDALEVCA
jgi:hypothetical protein